MNWELKAALVFVLLVCTWMAAGFAFGLMNNPSTKDFLAGLTLVFGLLVFWLLIIGNAVRSALVALNKKEETKENAKKSDSSVH